MWILFLVSIIFQRGFNVLAKRGKFKILPQIPLLGMLVSCASMNYTVKSGHDVNFVPLNDGQPGEPIAAKASAETPLSPGVWQVSSPGYASSFLYIPEKNAKSTTIQLQKTLIDSPRKLVHAIFEIQNLMRRRSNEEALTSIRQLRVSYPDVPDLALLQASILVITGDTPGAIALLKEVLKSNPEDADAKSLLSRISGGEKTP
jgi:predicted Zn-dependent protease